MVEIIQFTQPEKRKPRIMKSLSGRRVNVDKIDREIRKRVMQEKKEEHGARLRIRARLLDYFNPEMLPEIPLPEIGPFEIIGETMGEILRQVLDQPLG